MSSATTTMPAMSAPVKASGDDVDGKVFAPPVLAIPAVPLPFVVVPAEVTGAPTVSVSTGEVESV